MAKKKTKNKVPSKGYKHYKLEGNKLIRTKKTCPKCGPGYFLAQHKDREYCGHCGYTTFESKIKSEEKRTEKKEAPKETSKEETKPKEEVKEKPKEVKEEKK